MAWACRDWVASSAGGVNNWAVVAQDLGQDSWSTQGFLERGTLRVRQFVAG
jgi:hypothetical protein